MASPPLDYFDPEDLHPDILKDPNTPKQFSHIPVGPENVEKEINGHIEKHVEFAQSAKRSAIYETVSNSPVIVAALMGDLGAALNVAKTIPVYYEFWQGYDEGNDFARRLVRAKRIDKLYRDKHGYSDARIYHSLGLELTSDPELLNRPIDAEREKAIQNSIVIVKPLGARFGNVRENFEFALWKLQNDTTGAVLDSIGAVDDKITNTVKAIRNHDYGKTYLSVTTFDYFGVMSDFGKGCAHDVIDLFPKPIALKNDLMSVKKKDIKELNFSNIYNSFHAKHFGILGTFTMACAVVAHQTVDHVMMPPVRYLYDRYARNTVERTIDRLAFHTAPLTKKFKEFKDKTLKMIASKSKSSPDTTEEDDDDDFKVRSTPVTNPVNLHRVNREYQRILSGRKKDLRSCVFNTAALAGETYFVKSVGKDAWDTLSGIQIDTTSLDTVISSAIDESGSIGKGGFFALSAVLATAANNHICSHRIEMFNRLQSARSQMAVKNAKKISIEHSIQIVKDNIKSNETEQDPKAWFGDVIETLTLLDKVERRSFKRQEREDIRVYLNEVLEDLAIYDLSLGDDGLSTKKVQELMDKLDENYFKELPPLPSEDAPEITPN